MDYTKSEFWIALAIGGSLCAAASAVMQLTNKSQEYQHTGFKFRAVIRDFCLGAFLAATIYMLIPDSISNTISGFMPKGSFTGGGGSVEAPAYSASSSGDIELRVGPARF